MVIKDIKDGWLNYMILKIESMTTRLRLSDKFKKEVETRSNICRSCPSLSISRFLAQNVVIAAVVFQH